MSEGDTIDSTGPIEPISSLPSPPTPIPNPMVNAPLSGVFYWQPSTDTSVTHYEFTIPSQITAVVEASVISYNATSLKAGETFTASLRASNDGGITWGSEAFYPPFTPLQAPPAPPASAMATVVVKSVLVPQDSPIKQEIPTLKINPEMPKNEQEELERQNDLISQIKQINKIKEMQQPEPEPVYKDIQTVEVSWEPPLTLPDGNSYYLAETQTSDPVEPKVVYSISTPDLNQTSCVFYDLNIQTKYYFNVYVVNNAGYSAPAKTNEIQFQ